MDSGQNQLKKSKTQGHRGSRTKQHDLFPKEKSAYGGVLRNTRTGRQGQRNYIHIIQAANVGNHIHINLKLTTRNTYKKFIRAFTGAIALKIMRAAPRVAKVHSHQDRFWDYRPFTTFVTNFHYRLNMRDYMAINQLEGQGWHRTNARLLLAREKDCREQRWHLAHPLHVLGVNAHR